MQSLWNWNYSFNVALNGNVWKITKVNSKSQISLWTWTTYLLPSNMSFTLLDVLSLSLIWSYLSLTQFFIWFFWCLSLSLCLSLTHSVRSSKCSFWNLISYLWNAQITLKAHLKPSILYLILLHLSALSFDPLFSLSPSLSFLFHEIFISLFFENLFQWFRKRHAHICHIQKDDSSVL